MVLFMHSYKFLIVVGLVVLKTVILHKPLKRRLPLYPQSLRNQIRKQAAAFAFVSLLREPLRGGDDNAARLKGSQTLNHCP